MISGEELKSRMKFENKKLQQISYKVAKLTAVSNKYNTQYAK
jgi:hypothetical protein